MKSSCIGLPDQKSGRGFRKTMVLLLLAPVVAGFLGGGCIHHSTTAVREASFKPYKNSMVGPLNLNKHLLFRSAILFRSDLLNMTDQSSGTNAITCNISGTNNWCGTAAAVDHRGYFLTAAHCLEKGPFWLAFLNGEQMQVRPARVVWKGNGSKKQSDFALLHVALPLTNVFGWSDGCSPGDKVVAVGGSMEEPRASKPQLKTQCMGGRVLRTKAAPKTTPPITLVSHDVPVRPGDSGGPLAATDGRLLGINVVLELGFQYKHLSFEPDYAMAVRPDPQWLQTIIEQDAAVTR
jgi:S1-C subfamily serine protease